MKWLKDFWYGHYGCYCGCYRSYKKAGFPVAKPGLKYYVVRALDIMKKKLMFE